ncbi:MAG: urea ABC transporter substrate-binding protein [Pirellulaceae bacterium]
MSSAPSLGDAMATAADIPFSRIPMVTRFSLPQWLSKGMVPTAILATISLAGCDQIDPKWRDHLGLVDKPVPIRVGILHSETGTMSISETSLRDTELLAIAEINSAGGLLGRPIEPIVKDGRSRDDLFVKRARSLLEDYGLQVVFGCWTSSSRKAVTPLFEEEDALLFYPLQYEGNEASRNLFYFGSTPNQQILPAIDWFHSDAGGNRKKIYLVGSDYIYPRTAHYIVRKYLEGKEMEVVGESFAPLGSRDFQQVVSKIMVSKADLVLSTINGDSNVDFYQQFHQMAGQVGIDSDKLPIVATSVGENELRSLLPEFVQGHYVAASYFQSIDSSINRRFVEAFKKEYGEDRVADDPMDAAYVQVYLWKAAVEAAQSTDPQKVREALEKTIEFDGPGGKVRIDPRNHHLYKKFRLGRINGDRQLDIVHESPEPIQPEPFPQFAFPGWECDWTKEGLKKGEPVSLTP